MAPVVIRAYAERDNEIRRELLDDGEPLSVDQLSAITDVIIRAGDVCLSLTGGEIQIQDGVITAKLGKSLEPGAHDAWLTVKSTDYPDGVAWEKWFIVVSSWPVCAEST